MIYPNRAPPNPSSSQNRFKRDSAPSAPARDAPMFRGRTISQRQAPPQITRRNSSKSPPARGISYSPSKFDAHEISSDTDEEAMQKRPPRERKITLKKAKRSSSVSSSTSECVKRLFLWENRLKMCFFLHFQQKSQIWRKNLVFFGKIMCFSIVFQLKIRKCGTKKGAGFRFASLRRGFLFSDFSRIYSFFSLN